MIQIKTPPVMVLLLLFFFFFSRSVMADPGPTVPPHPSPYFESSCQGTQYPKVCINSLSGFPSGTIEGPQQIMQAALSVSFVRAADTREYLTRVSRRLKRKHPRDYMVACDCLNQMNNGVSQLGDSVMEVSRLGTNPMVGNFEWHISNVVTWVGSTITDATTCLDELPGERMARINGVIKGKMMDVAMVTSNALVLFHNFASKYGAQASSSTTMP